MKNLPSNDANKLLYEAIKNWEGAEPTCRVLDNPDLQEWREGGMIDDIPVRVYYIFDGDPSDNDFGHENVTRICRVWDDGSEEPWGN